MKNQFSKVVKYLEKSECFFAQRESDSVYITNGFILIKIPVYVYDFQIRPLSGQFIEIKDGEKVSRSSDDPFCRVDETGRNIKQILEYIKTDVEMIKSDFLVEIPAKTNSKKLTKARLFFTGNTVAGVNEMFVDMFSEIVTGSWCGDGKNISPIVWKSDSEDIIIVMTPLRLEKKIFEVWKDVSI